MKVVEAYKWNVQERMMEIVEVESYKDIQATLAFDHEESVTFDAVYFQVGNTPVTVYVDDEGLLKEEKTLAPYVSVLCNAVPYDENFASTPLVGNLLFTMADEKGETIDLDVDFAEIEKRIYPYMERGKSVFDLNL